MSHILRSILRRLSAVLLACAACAHRPEVATGVGMYFPTVRHHIPAGALAVRATDHIMEGELAFSPSPIVVEAPGRVYDQSSSVVMVAARVVVLRQPRIAVGISSEGFSSAIGSDTRLTKGLSFQVRATHYGSKHVLLIFAIGIGTP